MRVYTIAQLAQAAQVNPATVRYYERRGVLPKPPRNPSGHRQYAPDDLRRLRFIKSTQALGFSLTEIADLLSIRAEAGGSCRDVRQRIQSKMADVQKKIAALQKILEVLQQLETNCPGRGPLRNCPILAALDT